jgi:hypothetical protein
MTRKFLLSFAILAVSAVASAKSFSVTLYQPTIIFQAEQHGASARILQCILPKDG